MSNSGAPHFLASQGSKGSGDAAHAKSELLKAERGRAMAEFALSQRHGMIRSVVGTPEEQASSLYREGRKLALKRRYTDAEFLFRKALELDGAYRMIHTALGEVLEMMNKPEQAILAHIDALRLDPTDSKSLEKIGSFLMRLKQEEEAIGYFEAAVKFDPKNGNAWSRLFFLQRQHCNWTKLANTEKRVPLFKKGGHYSDPFALLNLADDPAMQKKVSETAAAVLKTEIDQFTFDRPRAEDRKIRIGYFSSDFHTHATMFLMGRQLALHDRSKFEIFLYDYGVKGDEEGRKKARETADTYRFVAGKEHGEIIRIAREDDLDIAVDLKGYTKDNRLNIFNRRLAPVHVSFLGYPGTTGLPGMDYMVADPVTIPARYRKHYSEKILYMPDCYQANDDQRSASQNRPARAEAGLPEDAFVFCSFNSPYKISPKEFDVWMKLLKLVPGSVLWLYATRSEIRENLLKEAQKRGIGAERIVFAGFAEQKDHLARLPLADVFLDCFAVNAHTTASDALWAGVPVVTKTGKQFAARVASSLLSAVGVSELAAASVTQYQALALKLARDPEYLADVKARVKQGIADGPLYDTEKFTRNFEALMEKALERYNAGLEPDHISLTQ